MAGESFLLCLRVWGIAAGRAFTGRAKSLMLVLQLLFSLSVFLSGHANVLIQL